MKTLFRPLLLATFALGATATTRAALVAGDVAIIGWLDNGTVVDSFAFVTLAPISAGENIYFTDNGWNGATFRQGSGGLTDGDGAEGLIKWTATAAVPAGQIIQSTGTGGNFLWTRTETIALGGTGVPGATSGQFTDLAIGNPAEQIYAFQATDNNPLFNPTVHLFLLDDTGVFEPAIDNDTGSVTPGLTVGQTALTFSAATFGAARSIAFQTGSLSSGNKSQWLTAIANPNNWTTVTGTLPSGSIVVTPEPTAAFAFATGLGVLLSQRRRRKA
jgi:hypothetical protein